MASFETLVAQWEENRVVKTARLSINDFFLKIRSRQGFALFLRIFRWIAFFAILYRFAAYPVTQGHSHDSWALGLVVIYLFFLLLDGYLQNNRPDLLNRERWHIATIVFEATVFLGLIYLSDNIKSDLYLFLLLPLLTTAHFTGRRINIFSSILIFLGYFLVGLILDTDWGVNVQTGVRGLFLVVSAFLFRVQRGLPSPSQNEVIEPVRAREHLEEILKELAELVPHETVSLQILYRGRFQVVACLGFPNPEDIYQLEFPAFDDKRYPNHQVVREGQVCIVSAVDYPSFQEPGYFASHIKTWMGVPLHHPATGELFGLLSIDSAVEQAYSPADGRKAQKFANRAAAYLIEAALGPAALTLMAKRQTIEHLLDDWAKILPTRTAKWEDSLQAAQELVKSGQKIFNVEDCSISFIHHILDADGEPEKVLHLVASSAIPPSAFINHQSRITGKHKDGLTGRAVFSNYTLNHGRQKLIQSPFWSGYTGHLEFLFSKISRQVMIVPLRDSLGEPIGAIKLENKMGQANESQFSDQDQRLFEIFAAMVSLMLESIRQRNYIERQAQDVHDLRGVVLPAASNLTREYFENAPRKLRRAADEKVKNVQAIMEYCESVLHGLLIERGNNHKLETEGVAPALYDFVQALIRTDLPWLAPACRRIEVEGLEVRDTLPFPARAVLYNIGREAVRNIARHSGIQEDPSGFGHIKISFEDDLFEMQIEDNGRGFDLPVAITPMANFGLADFRLQFDKLRKLGELEASEIISALGKGTRIFVRWRAKQLKEKAS